MSDIAKMWEYALIAIVCLMAVIFCWHFIVSVAQFIVEIAILVAIGYGIYRIFKIFGDKIKKYQD